MATVTAYWRPTSIAEVIELLDRPDTVLIGGGTRFNEQVRPEVITVSVVDLQSCGLGAITEVGGGRLSIGATSTLQRIAGDERVPDVVRDAARRELPSTLRNQATIGGCIASGDKESELLAALLAHEATVSLGGSSRAEDVPLAELLVGGRERLGRRVITSVTLSTGGATAAARTARTTADRPIVAAVAVVRAGRDRALVAMSGVAPVPVLVDDPSTLTPPGDFRGSSEYRRALATVLFARVTEALS